MQKYIILLIKVFKLIKGKLLKPIDWLVSYCVFYGNGVTFSTFSNYGWPKVNVGYGGVLKIGSNFRSNNREIANPIGRFNPCSLIVAKSGHLYIGDNVGMSSTAIVCHERINIGNNVNLGGNVVIYDTDFHSLCAEERLVKEIDVKNTKTKPVTIGNGVFIGAHTTILKGVTIGDSSVIGACSVVTKSIPANEIWAGNPARKIKSVNTLYQV